MQNVEVAVLHAVGTGWESAFRRGDIEAGYAVNRAFNDWLFEDWGYAHENRILVPVPIPLLDVDYAVTELERCLERGAKFVDLQPGPASTTARRSTPTSTRSGPWSTRPAPGSPSTSAAPTPGMGAEWSENPKARYQTSTASSGSPTGATGRSWTRSPR